MKYMPLAAATSPEKATCLRCSKQFTRRHGNQRYCSSACSAYVRNRRYYATVRGRAKKREGQSRYFSRYPWKQYENKAARMARWVEARWEAFVPNMRDGSPPTEEQRLWAWEAAVSNARWQIDFHPTYLDGPRGRDVSLKCADGRLRFYTTAGNTFEMGRNGALIQVERGAGGSPVESRG